MFYVFQELQEDSRRKSSAFGEAEETALTGLTSYTVMNGI